MTNTYATLLANYVNTNLSHLMKSARDMIAKKFDFADLDEDENGNLSVTPETFLQPLHHLTLDDLLVMFGQGITTNMPDDLVIDDSDNYEITLDGNELTFDDIYGGPVLKYDHRASTWKLPDTHTTNNPQAPSPGPAPV